MNQSLKLLMIAITALGLSGVGWSFYELQKLFLTEHQRSVNGLEVRRIKVQDYAHQALQRKLTELAQTALEQAQQAVENPLLIDEQTYWRQNGVQRQPLSWKLSRPRQYQRTIAISATAADGRSKI